MKKKLLTALMCLPLFGAFAQSNAIVTGGTGADRFIQPLSVQNTEVVWLGYSTSNQSAGDVTLTTTDLTGNILTNVRLNIAGTQIPTKMVEREGGGFIIVGRTHNTHASGRAFILATDAAGAVSWYRELSTANCAFDNVIQLQSGNIIAVGGRNYNSPDGLLVRFDANNGNIVWQRSLDNLSGSNTCTFIHQDITGEVWIGGHFSTIAGSTGNHDVWLAQLDLVNGGAVNDNFRRFSSTFGEHSQGIRRTANGGFVWTTTGVLGGSGNTGYSHQGRLQIVMIDSLMDTSPIVRQYANTAINLEQRDMEILEDGNIMVTGIFNNGTSKGADIFTALFDTQGETLGAKFWGGSANENVFRITQVNGTQVMIAGSSASYSSTGATGENALMLFPSNDNIIACQDSILILNKFTNTLALSNVTAAEISTSYTATTATGVRTPITYISDELSCCRYEFGSDTVSCSDFDGTICVPLNSTEILPAGIIGLDYTITYDPALLTPTGNVTLGGIVTTNGGANSQFFVNTTNAGQVNVSIYYTNAATFLQAIGNVACIEFSPTANYVLGTALNFDDFEVRESYTLSVVPQCAEPGVWRIMADSVMDARVIYRADMNNGLGSNATMATNVAGDNANCNAPTATITATNNLGNFTFNIANGTQVRLTRDINNATPPSQLVSVINNADCQRTSLVTTLNVNQLPNPSFYDMLSMDVNMDDEVSAGDITLIQNRIVGINASYPQVWNGGVVAQGLDWRFVDDATVLNNATDFTISNTYPNNGGIGYSKYNVPNVPTCLPIPINQDSVCISVDSMVYHGILLGDADGNWLYANNGTVLRGSQIEEFVVDVANASKNGNCEFSVPVYYNGTNSITGLDLVAAYDNSRLTVLGVDELSGNLSMMWNDWQNTELAITGYTPNPNGFLSNQPILMLHVSTIDGQLSAADFGTWTSYFAADPAQVSINGTAACTVGVEEGIAGVQVYPNPFSSILTVKYPAGSGAITLYDAQGKLVLSAEMNASGSTEMETATLASGVYMLKIGGNTYKLTK